MQESYLRDRRSTRLQLDKRERHDSRPVGGAGPICTLVPSKTSSAPRVGNSRSPHSFPMAKLKSANSAWSIVSSPLSSSSDYQKLLFLDHPRCLPRHRTAQCRLSPAASRRRRPPLGRPESWHGPWASTRPRSAAPGAPFRSPVACSMQRSDHPSRPCGMNLTSDATKIVVDATQRLKDPATRILRKDLCPMLPGPVVLFIGNKFRGALDARFSP